VTASPISDAEQGRRRAQFYAYASAAHHGERLICRPGLGVEARFQAPAIVRYQETAREVRKHFATSGGRFVCLSTSLSGAIDAFSTRLLISVAFGRREGTRGSRIDATDGSGVGQLLV